MYRIDSRKNQIVPLEIRSFTDLGFKEREHLQEWIADEPSVLGEELLIIQKEFSGFDDTQERIDLMALDKQGSLVIIENKLDDSGKNVTWQALKYASYCYSLSKKNIIGIYQDYLDKYSLEKNSTEELCDFFEVENLEEISLNTGVSQRIILVAANFRKEVTSTVTWLLNYNIRIQCFRATPYSMGDDLYLNVDQIIPTQESQDFLIGIAEKAQGEIEDKNKQARSQSKYGQFWAQLLPVMRDKSENLFQNISPSNRQWVGASSGVRGVVYNFVISRKYIRVEVYIDRGNREENKAIFDQLFREREKIEQLFGCTLIWERLESKRASRVKYDQDGDIDNYEKWPTMNELLVDSMLKLEKAFQEQIKKAGTQLARR